MFTKQNKFLLIVLSLCFMLFAEDIAITLSIEDVVDCYMQRIGYDVIVKIKADRNTQKKINKILNKIGLVNIGTNIDMSENYIGIICTREKHTKETLKQYLLKRIEEEIEK